MADNRINELFKIYRAITGRSLVPKNTEPENTYQWRYASKFVSNMDSLGIRWPDARKVAYYVIKRAVKNKNKDKTVWSRGLWILTSKSVIDIAYEDSKNDVEAMNVEIEKIRKSYRFALRNQFDFLSRKHPDAFPNIVLWYDSANIGTSYISLSRRCEEAMSQIDRESRNMLPDSEVISDRRISCFIDKEYLSRIKSILKDDFLRIT
jgi:hypothetical protein